MAHKIGLNDTQYEPDICGAVDFGFFDDDDNDVERTKGSKSAIVKNSVVVASESSHNHHHHPKPVVIESSSVGAGKCIGVVDSCFLEDTSCGRFGLTVPEEEASRRCLKEEGRQGSEEAMRNEDRATFGSSSSERGTIGNTSSIEAHEPNPSQEDEEPNSGAVMEHVIDPHPYSSDEWEESEESSDTDSEDDHSDSSDDDDPKSQVDRLIERGTLIYMDGENSNLSSETESSDYDDSDSDITDVSPLISATASPLGLSPVLPRRTLGTSPLALHDNRELAVDYRPDIANDQGYDSQPHCNGSGHSNSDDSTDMTLLLKAVVELEKKQKRQQQNNHISNEHLNNRHHYHHKNYQNSSRHHHSHNHHHHHSHHHHNHHHNNLQPTSPITIHPIDASPHHRHLRRAPPSHSHRRKNMSFSNDDVRRIDRENQILLHKIMSAHTKSQNQSSSNQNNNNRSVQRPANSTVNRKREEEKIRRENMILLRKIQEAKPSRDVTASRSPRHRTTHSVRPPSSLPATPGSCGASAGTV